MDAKATTLEVSIGSRDLLIHQSPTILSSNRGGGTTGAGWYTPQPLLSQSLKALVVWKITPLFASWITLSSNLIFRCNILESSSTVLELGCGISGIIGLALAPQINSYVMTDQDYVLKLLLENLSENQQDITSSSKGRKSTPKAKRGNTVNLPARSRSNIAAQTLDWETDEVTPSLTGSESDQSFEAVIACDCIYNDALIDPLVQTCVDTCKLRITDPLGGTKHPTVCIVAQQLRSAEVFEGWLKAFFKFFRVWRVPDNELIDGMKSDSGFVVHIGILRE